MKEEVTDMFGENLSESRSTGDTLLFRSAQMASDNEVRGRGNESLSERDAKEAEARELIELSQQLTGGAEAAVDVLDDLVCFSWL